MFKVSKPSLNDIDTKLEKYLDFEDGFYIEAGANDGYCQSNTYFLEKTKKWQGVLVEPMPVLFEQCKLQRPRSKVFNRALVSNEFQGETVKMHYANLMSLVDGAMKSEREQTSHINSGVKVQHLDDTYTVNVATSTLESILDSHDSISKIDFFSLDVEGYELEVLKGLNLKRYRPTYILVEARYFEEVDDFLLGNGYIIIDQFSHHDYLYIDSKVTA